MTPAPSPGATLRGAVRALAVLLFVLCASPAPVEAYAPWIDWRTLTTPNFRIHYPVGYYREALHFGRAAETAFEELVMRLGWRPDTPIEVVLNDDTDSANGFARSLPYNLIGLNAVAPDDLSVLNDYDDWRYLLMAHELVHIIHIDTIRGFPEFLNAVLGRQFVPNAILPRWLIEGMAVYFESSMTSAGRIRSSFFEMMLRMHGLEDRTMSLDEVTGFPQRWPQGTAAYLYGGHFVDFMVENYGEDFFRNINFDYGDDIIPYGVNVTARRALGKSYLELYEKFLEMRSEKDHALQSRVESRGRIEGRRLTHTAQDTGTPRYAPDGALYYVERPIDDRPTLRRWREGGSERVAFVEVDPDIAFVPDAQEAIVSFADVHDFFRFYQDLYRVDLETGQREQLTFGARALSPDIASDRRIVFVQQEGGHSVLRLAHLDDLSRTQTLVDLGPDSQVFTPRFVEGGAAVVFSGFHGGQRDLYRVETESGEWRRLTADRFIDGGPMPSADGRSVFFHSDRGGVYDIYVIPAEGGAARRVTRVLGGAFRPAPSPDGTTLAYQSYSAEGFDVSVLSLPSDLTLLPEEPVPSIARPEIVEVPETEIYPSEEYSVWPSILPRSWLPVLATDTQGTALGAAVTGVDAVEEHRYALQVTRGIESAFTGFFAQYRNSMFFPGFTLSAERALRFANVALERNGEREGVEEDVWAGELATNVPLWNRIDNSGSLIFAYNVARRLRTEPLIFDPLDASPQSPSEGRFASLFMGATVSNVRGFTNSISSEEGGRLTLGLRIEDELLGSEYEAVSVTANAAVFFENPWVDRHVLAFQGFAGYGVSNYRRRSLFSISGLPAADLVLNILNLNFGAGSALRGFPLEPIVGDAIVEGHLEYRFPIWDVQTGVETLPVYFGNLSAAPFVDAALVADDLPGLTDRGNRYASVGAELRLELVLGYGIGTTLRAGYGAAVLGEDSQAGYLVFGGTF